MTRCVSPPEPKQVLASEWPLCQSFSLSFCIRWNLWGAARFARWHRYREKEKVCTLDNVQKKKQKAQPLSKATGTLRDKLWIHCYHLARRQTILHISCSKQNLARRSLTPRLSDGTWYYSLDLWNHVHFSCSARQKIKKAIIRRIKSVAAAPSVHQSALWDHNTLCRGSLINSCSHFHTAGVGRASPTVNAQQEYFTPHTR